MMTQQELERFYKSRKFDRQYTYNGRDLGAVCSENGTTIKLWSPVADRVILHLYRNGDGGMPYASIPMEESNEGVWQYATKEKLHGVYYDYEVSACGKTQRTADPYAKACGVNGLRSMIVDLSRTDPEGWEQDRAPEKSAEDIIYELHVKEYSWDESAGFPEHCRGKYTAFLAEDTTLCGDGMHPTGMKYLRELGVTHIQLMPVFDYGSVDEAGDDGQFNWGYDPVNYNVPEGSYSTDPFHGEVRIKELKEAVAALHRNGFRVIMDVVYNHTFSLDSSFQKTVPWYYYRRWKDGRVSEGSCCGNDFASERPMAARYILDSVLYWTEEYHMDGFRFDLMGLLDTDLMNRIQKELDFRYGAGEKLIYGEPWSGTDTAMEKGFVQALKKNERLLDPNIGMFCDNTRDAVKGHVFQAKVPGFVNGGTGLEEDILHAVSAWCDGSRELNPQSPKRILSYLSAHDNFTLWDKLILTLCPKDGYYGRKEEVLRAYRLAAAICFTCQGRLFFLSGEEFARTKEGIEDSFCSPVEINRLDYRRAYEFEDLVTYYKGLIGLRKRLPGLCDKSERAANRIFRKRIEAERVVSFCVDNCSEDYGASGDYGASEDYEAGRDGMHPEITENWYTVFTVYNSSETAAELELPAGEWYWLLKEGDSSLWKQRTKPVNGRITVAPVSAAVLGTMRIMEKNRTETTEVVRIGGGEDEV